MEQIEAVGPPKPLASKASEANEPAQLHTKTSDSIEVFSSGGRLQITANVGRPGITKLKAMLDKYDEILKLDENLE